MKTACTIAGSDSSGGAGIQADIKTMTMNGVFATIAITALTAQNTRGVTGILEVHPDFLAKEIDAICMDIRPDALKIGMVSNAALIDVIGEKIRQYQLKNIVVDPVMIATSGATLMDDKVIDLLAQRLLPLATVITPNILEAEILSGIKIRSKAAMERAAKRIYEMHQCAVLCKGGHRMNDANDVLVLKDQVRWYKGNRINNPNTHGTGCTLSSAIASNLAKNYDLDQSVKRAKNYVSKALSAMLDLGQGSGPMNHMFDLTGEFTYENRSF